MTHNVVFLDRDSLPVPVPVFGFPVHYREYPATASEQLAAHAAGADIVISNKVPLSREAIAALPELRLVAIAATGYNHVDLDACRERGVAVCNIRHYGDHTVAEHAFMLMMALMKNLPAYQRDVAAGVWSQSRQFCHFGAPIREVRGATLAIVGSGGIGGRLAQMARAFGMEVLFAERKGATRVREERVPFDEALARADVVSLHCPLTEETRGMIAQPELMAMKPGAILINTARGGLVDEADLVAALKYGQLGGAGFDVLSSEPPSPDNPLLKARLPNLIVTPHVGWASGEAMRRLAAQLVANIEAFVDGRKVNRLI
ncbi:D-2-hydroxyacid dehydrogenase [Chromobacterium violaceum]|uniref:Probable glycerate dehydrogenase n=1 Tax=Chromobacterium violaceum (strain ATCC 12472 / DSM 30191 / JCM 1249 / CCUG 213 / NBRC 12614 / NCIMB 9131 / NCTC 9757 / MK) TaxID=243365 RepID=Q7NRJ2_CHRVO|nr:D-2-hydroxyacid dehydrogenase [Chromobacterium violaceum]AAQ61451.1 probable glycerate dehydrogenase [Chromobacterium violaceum ATCC 12472]SUX88491.1 Putative 2-hydroxyacid dehydrogenase HI_1556 [Chromobacterium violaceum]